MKMPSKKQYDLVSEDGCDARIPLHNEEAFQHGICFQAKYIGTLDVPRPSSRVEIVAAMRRIRYEFKAKAIKKRKIGLTISLEGTKVVLRKKKKKHQWALDEGQFTLMQYPIYRIFYVSHDSQDLKIFSFIARDAVTNVFKCNVFKAYKKSQAMRIVRTIGQAFEVCHKITMEHNHSNNSQRTDVNANGLSTNTLDEQRSDEFDYLTEATSPDSGQTPDTELSMPITDNADVLPLQIVRSSQNVRELARSPQSPRSPLDLHDSCSTPLSSHHQIQMLRQRLDQQQQQTQVAVAHAHLLKDQLATETAARIEAQTRTHQLLVQNRELLEHINQLVGRLQDIELQANGVLSPTSNSFQIQQDSVLTDPATPSSLPTFTDYFRTDNAELTNTSDLGTQNANQRVGIYENANTKTDHSDSPDSGHVDRDMSCDSLTYSFNPENSWQPQKILTSISAKLFSDKSNDNNTPARSSETKGNKVKTPPVAREVVRLEDMSVPKIDPPPAPLKRDRSLSGKRTLYPFTSTSNPVNSGASPYLIGKKSPSNAPQTRDFKLDLSHRLTTYNSNNSISDNDNALANASPVILANGKRTPLKEMLNHVTAVKSGSCPLTQNGIDRKSNGDFPSSCFDDNFISEPPTLPINSVLTLNADNNISTTSSEHMLKDLTSPNNNSSNLILPKDTRDGIINAAMNEAQC